MSAVCFWCCAQGLDLANVRFKGPTKSRSFALRGLAASGVQITAFEDITPIHATGTRARKARRL
jgi:ribosomal protein S11